MAIVTMVDCLVLINGVTLSDHSNEITVTDSRSKVDVTAFGATHTANAKGTGEGSIQIKLFQDMAAGKTHATLSPLIGSTTPVAVEVRMTSAARSATNPAALLGSALLFDYSMLDGSMGDAAMTTAVFDNAPGGAGITYPTA